jgi:hypothetical protein
MNQQKRAIYDEDLLNNSEGLYYMNIWGFKINVILFFFFAVCFFLSKYAYDYYKNILKVKFTCPLGHEKFEVDKLKFSEKNMKMLNFIEKTKEELLNGELASSKKVAEDDEYEYFIEEERKN